MSTQTDAWRVDSPAHLGTVVTDDDERIIVAENLFHEHARLIAIAPDLLEVAKAMVRLDEVGAPLNDIARVRIREAARAAIAKAKGQP